MRGSKESPVKKRPSGPKVKKGPKGPKAKKGPKVKKRPKGPKVKKGGQTKENGAHAGEPWSFDAGKFVAGACVGGVLAATARECRKIKKREESGEPSGRALRVPSAR
tara:strand:- start:287 stop:607 length:321 start_codon:yes stop_codon:yes gene_type:complete